MATTYAQREAAAAVVMTAGGGHGAIVIPCSTDFTYTKDPLGTVPTAGGKTPVNGETTPFSGWVLWTGADEQSAYAL